MMAASGRCYPLLYYWILCRGLLRGDYNMVRWALQPDYYLIGYTYNITCNCKVIVREQQVSWWWKRGRRLLTRWRGGEMRTDWL